MGPGIEVAGCARCGRGLHAPDIRHGAAWCVMGCDQSHVEPKPRCRASGCDAEAVAGGELCQTHGVAHAAAAARQQGPTAEQLARIATAQRDVDRVRGAILDAVGGLEVLLGRLDAAAGELGRLEAHDGYGLAAVVFRARSGCRDRLRTLARALAAF
jgi:hypothetical protein